MQNAKDSFYMVLRTRLATIDPERTVLVRSVVRPGILMEEAEAPMPQPPNDVFLLRWLGFAVDINAPETMVANQCEIVYATAGTQSFGGLDRGRALSLMDSQLLEMLNPHYTQKMNYADQPAVAMTTNIFWDSPVFGATSVERDRLTRTARVVVYSYQESGE